MKEFIDETSEKEGTPINRSNLMAMQGFVGATISFLGDSIVKTFSNGETLTTTFNSDGTITETFVGEKTITKTMSFVANGVTEEVS